MSLKGMRVLPHVSHGGRYVLGQPLVSSSYGTAVVVENFGLLAETGAFLLTETSAFLEIEHS